MKRLIMATMVVAMLVLSVTPAFAARPASSPAEFCRSNEMGIREFLPTMGGCVSTVASVGVEALLSGEAVPSTAAFVHQCKALEETDFLDPAEPNAGGPYPYQFYWFFGSDPDLFTAYNRADCVELLQAFHSGALAPPFPEG